MAEPTNEDKLKTLIKGAVTEVIAEREESAKKTRTDTKAGDENPKGDFLSSLFGG